MLSKYVRELRIKIIMIGMKLGLVVSLEVYAILCTLIQKTKKADWEKKLKAVFDPEFQGIQDTLTGLMYEDDAKSCYEKKYESNC